MIDQDKDSPDFNPKDAGASFEKEFLGEFTETPTPAEPAPPTPVATEPRPAEKAPSGPSRDEQGRFAKPAPPVEPSAPTATAPAALPATAAAEVPPAPTPEAPLPPASYRADGQEFTIEGSQRGADGVFIPAAQWGQIERLLGQGQVHQGSFQKRMSESAQSVQREKTRADAAEASKAAVFDKLVKMAQDGTIEDWIADVRTNLPVLLAKAEQEGTNLRLKDYEAREQAREREATDAQREPQMQTALSNAIQHYGAKAGLSEARMRQLYARLNTPEYRRALFFEAQEDDPIQGIRKGETVIALGLVENEIAWAGTGQPAVDKVAAAAAANAKAAGSATAPPTVGAGAGPAPKAVAAPKKFKNAQEADEHIWSDEGFAELGRR